ncbi:MAG TPA: DEAD/DEAH box helicase [Verrucomicrobiae bacterium]|jgi:ATP-dependent RNA helicase DeaD|nr:DEAD/DEAH box helicase [Verrucomicrobiae bacterium]
MTTKLFSELGISPELLKAIDKLGFEQASPIQAEAIPVLLQGRDVVGQSRTGSGKTAAFAVPAIEKVDPQLRAVQMVILCPTRELAVQVSEEVHKLALFKRGIHALPIYGGQSYERQFLGLKQGAQIVIGTPGRVMDHMRRGTLRLEKVKMVILDEADVMLDMGFREDIEFILQAVPKERQTVFFSATMPRPIQELIQKYSRDPQNVRIEQTALTVPTVEQIYYEVDRRYKIELLTRLIDIHDLKLGIIFCNTKRMVDDLVDHLNAQGYSADRLHGDMSQAMRDRVMNKFRKSGLEFLVATDVAARGIDVDDVQVVFNYDLPYDVEDYLHRIGRTGRAGRSGRAISFAAGRELFQIYNIERYTKVKMHHGRPPTQNEVDEARANVFLEKLRGTLQSGEYKRQDHLIERLLEEGFTSTDIASALLHQLQAGEGVAAAKTVRTETSFRDERPERSDRRSAPRDSRSAPRDSAPTRKPWRTADENAPRPTPAPRIERPILPAPRPPVSPRVVTAPKPIATDDPVKAVPQAPSTPKPTAPTPRPLPFPDRRPAQIALRPSAPPPKISRRTPETQTRLYMNIGEEMDVKPGDVVGAILGETGLPAAVVGTVDIRERHLFVDVASEHANGIISKLNRTRIKNHKLKVKVA